MSNEYLTKMIFMDEIAKLIKYLESSTSSPLGLIIVAIISILLYKSLEKLLPDILKGIANFINQKFQKSQKDSRIGIKLRSFVELTANTNWIFSLKSLEKFNANIGLNEIFQLPSFSKAIDDVDASIDIQNILFKSQSFAITGRPGSGKSAMLSNLAYLYAKDLIAEQLGVKDLRIPFLINLRNVRSFDCSLSKLVADYYSEKNCEVSEDFIIKQLEKNTCVLLFDGLDEVTNPKLRKVVSTWFFNVIANYPGNRFIISCRDLDWVALKIPRLEEYRLSKLSMALSLQIADRWKSALSENYSGNLNYLIDKITKDENNHQWIINNPLLLTIFILLSANNIKIPESRSSLYKVFINVLLKEWSATKDNYEKPNEYLEKVFRVIQTTALFLIGEKNKGEVIDLTDEETQRFVLKQIQHYPILKDSQDVELLFSELSTTGIISIVSEGVYTFSNRGFFEYLAAQEIEKQQAFHYILDNFRNDIWHEIVILYFELSKNPANLRHFINSNYQNSSYYRILSELVIRNIVPTDLFNIVEAKLLLYLPQIFDEPDVDQPLINNLYKINQVKVVETITNEIKKNHSDIKLKRIAKAFALINDKATVMVLPFIFKSVTLEIKKVIIFWLRYNKYSTHFLWKLLTDNEMKDVVMESLVEKGLNIYDQTKKIINSSNGQHSDKKLIICAVDLLLKFDRPETLVFVKDSITTLPLYVVEHIDEITSGSYRDIIGSKLSIGRTSSFIKRGFDIILSSIILFISTPFFIVFYFLIKIDSRGPVIFKTLRRGKHGPFFIYKFRTAYVNYRSDMVQASRSDDRLTKVGIILKKLNLDQLPYFYNVLIGDISIVGPRILPLFIAEQADRLQFLFDDLYNNFKPGIIGYGLVLGFRGESRSFDLIAKSLEKDLYYGYHYSFMFDIKILAIHLANYFKGEENSF